MTVTSPARGPETGRDRDLERRVADLEALIEEARRRARRRRRIYAAIVLTALGAAAWASYGVGGNGGVSFGRSAAGRPSVSTAAALRSGRWVPTGGPEGGGVLSLAVDPAKPAILYAGGWGNVFKSTDGGRRWRVVSHEPWTQVTALAIDPAHPGTVYAGTERGVGKSVDGGRHWHMANAGMVDPGLSKPGTLLRWGREHWFGGLLVDPNRHRTVYALVNGGLFRTRNGGGHWRFLRPRLGRFWLLSAATLDPAHPGTLYASWNAYRAGSRLYKTTDGGSSWQLIAVRGAEPSFTSLVIDPDTPGTILATDDSFPGVYTSTDGGTTWTVVTLPLKDADGLRVFPGSRGTLYATTGSGAVFTSTDAGASWQRVATEAALNGLLVVDPRNPETLYGSSDGVEKSVDGGRTWSTSQNGLVNTLISSLAVAPGNPTTLYAGAYGRVYKSTDHGRTWRPETTGLGAASVTTLAVDPQSPRIIFAGDAWGGLGGARWSGLLKSVDGGLTWNRVQTGYTENAVRALAIDPRHPGTIYVGACNGYCTRWSGAFLKTFDGGATWRRITLPRRGVVLSLAVDPRTGNTVFAGTSLGGLFRSRDVAGTWQRVAVAHGGPTSHRGAPNAVTAIAIDPRDPDTVYAGTLDDGILKSTDGGNTWIRASTGLTGLDITTLAVDPRNPQVVFAAATIPGASGGAQTVGVVFRSANGGASWQRYGRGLPAGGVTAFATAGDNVYAATNGGGVVSLRPGG